MLARQNHIVRKTISNNFDEMSILLGAADSDLIGYRSTEVKLYGKIHNKLYNKQYCSK